MKLIIKIFLSVLLIIYIMSYSQAVLAAYNDSILTTDAVLSVGGYTLNITGSSAAIESITVDTTSFSVTLGNGSSIAITSLTRNALTPSSQTGVSSNTCTDSASTLTLAYSGSGTITNTITPEASTCTIPIVPNTPSPAVSNGSVSSGGSSVSPQVLARLLGQTLPNTQTIKIATAMVSFVKNLEVGSKGNDVKVLQQYLNAKGYIISKSGAGSPGKETDKFGALTRQALVKFQKANKIYPAIGFFGPITRAFIQKNP